MNKAILDVINSQELKDELQRIQLDMYELGKLDFARNLVNVLTDMRESQFTKENVITILKGAITLGESMRKNHGV